MKTEAKVCLGGIGIGMLVYMYLPCCLSLLHVNQQQPGVLGTVEGAWALLTGRRLEPPSIPASPAASSGSSSSRGGRPLIAARRRPPSMARASGRGNKNVRQTQSGDTLNLSMVLVGKEILFILNCTVHFIHYFSFSIYFLVSHHPTLGMPLNCKKMANAKKQEWGWKKDNFMNCRAWTCFSLESVYRLASVYWTCTTCTLTTV